MTLQRNSMRYDHTVSDSYASLSSVHGYGVMVARGSTACVSYGEAYLRGCRHSSLGRCRLMMLDGNWNGTSGTRREGGSCCSPRAPTPQVSFTTETNSANAPLHQTLMWAMARGNDIKKIAKEKKTDSKINEQVGQAVVDAL